MLTRRELGRLVLGAPLLLAAGRSEGQRRVSDSPAPDPGGRSTLPTGELAERIRLTADRLALGPPPIEDLEARGLHLGAVALLPPGGLDPAPFARELRARQRPDGGFGEGGDTGGAPGHRQGQTSRLRASGRILVGLLEHAEATGDLESLGAATRLGAFVQRAVAGASDARGQAPPLAEDLAALTQLAEGLVLLGEASGEPRFLEAARALRPHFGPRDGARAADYLCSLRGLLHLATVTGDETLQRDALSAYHDLVQSSDVSLLDGAPEVFGGREAGDPAATAELVRVSLQVWRVGGAVSALERAEHLLLNPLFAAQRASGDFAAKATPSASADPAAAPSPAEAGSPAEVAAMQWRPTLAAYRTLRDAIDSLARREKETTFVDLFLDADIREPGFLLSIRHESDGPGASRLVVEVLDAAPGLQGLSVRRPSWAASSFVRFDGSRLSPPVGPRVTFQRRWRAGEVLELILEHAVRVETRDHRSLSPAGLAADTEGVLQVGPWLMAADDASSPAFFSAPGPGARTVLLPPTLAAAEAGEGLSRFVDRARHLRLSHRTPQSGMGAQGGDSSGALTLAPISEATGRAFGRMTPWLRYRRVD